MRTAFNLVCTLSTACQVTCMPGSVSYEWHTLVHVWSSSTEPPRPSELLADQRP
jgi:hypothetical protein